MLSKETFNEIQQRLVTAWHRGDLDRAFLEIETVMREGSPEMKGQCLFFRGMIYESNGSLNQARLDWLDALHYAEDGTFLRYELEMNIGAASEKLSTGDDALTWYRAALMTCVNGHEFSPHQALDAFRRLSGTEISPEDKPLLTTAVEKSWRVLELPGKPDQSDLTSSINQVTQSFNEIIEKARQT